MTGPGISIYRRKQQVAPTGTELDPVAFVLSRIWTNFKVGISVKSQGHSITNLSQTEEKLQTATNLQENATFQSTNLSASRLTELMETRHFYRQE